MTSQDLSRKLTSYRFEITLVTPPINDRHRHFASDNYAGICPEAWAAMERANCDHAPGYGDDIWTAKASDLIRDLFETDCEVFFVFNGTAANSLALSTMCQSYHSILCHQLAHIETDECGAPEFFSNGSKILLLPGENGRIDPRSIESAIKKRIDIHYPKPRVLSITQATELGTVYSLEQLCELSETAKRFGLNIHMDGARFANAIAALGCSPKEVTWKLGVDALCFGGTKNGMAVGDAVVFFNKELAKEFAYRCKQSGQLASKMRFLSAPWVGLIESGAWLKNAQAANRSAERLEKRLAEIPGIKFMSKRQVNSVFLELPTDVTLEMRKRGWRFYTFIGDHGARFMCSWDTTNEDVDSLVENLKDVLGCLG